MNRISRRRFLRLSGAALSGFTAGCSEGTEPTVSESLASDMADTHSRNRTTGETQDPGETPTRTAKEQTPVVACEQTWAGEPANSFDGADSLDRAVPSSDRVFVGSNVGLLALTPDLDLVWRQSRVGGDVSEVTADMVLASEGDRVVAADYEQGEVLWTFEPPGDYARVAWGPAIHDGTVYVAASQVPTPSTDPETEYGRLYGLQVGTGAELFVTDLAPDDEEWVQPIYLIADAAGVFLTLDTGGLLRVSQDGTVRWRRAGDDWYYPPNRVGDFVLQPRSQSVVAVTAETGETQWESERIEMHVTTKADVVYGAGGGSPTEDGTLSALDAKTGQSRWETSIQGCGRQPVVGSGTLAIPVGCRDSPGHVGLYDTETGCRYGSYRQSADLTPALATGHSRLYASVGGDRGRLLGFDLPPTTRG